MGDFNRRLTIRLVSVFAIILSVVIFGEGFGWFDFLDDLIPFPLGVVIVLAGGYPVFMNVIRAERIGTDTTFGRVVKMVEEAEVHRADVQRVADKFSARYLPVLTVIAGLTVLFTRNRLSTAAVLLVACSCSFALATPVAMLASVGASATCGLLIKGGKDLELLAHADVLLVDKTGTLTLGQPQLTDRE